MEEEQKEAGKGEETEEIKSPPPAKGPKHHSEGKKTFLKAAWPAAKRRPPISDRFLLLTASDYMKTGSLDAPLRIQVPQLTMRWFVEKLEPSGFVSFSELNKNLGKKVRALLEDGCEPLSPLKGGNPERIRVLVLWGYIR